MLPEYQNTCWIIFDFEFRDEIEARFLVQQYDKQANQTLWSVQQRKCCNDAVLLTQEIFLYITLRFSAEIPKFLSEDECRVVMQLAQLKGLMESQLMVQDGQEELAKELNLSPEEIFNLLDINQDGQLQLHEVHVSLWNMSTWIRVG